MVPSEAVGDHSILSSLRCRHNEPYCLGGGMDSALFYILLFVHLGSLILGFGSVLVTDLYGFLWALNRVRFAQVVKVSGVTELFIWIGWSGMVISGIPLIILKGEIDRLMIMKFFFVVLVGVNGIPLHYLQKAVQRFKESDFVPSVFIFRLGLALFVSQLGWWGAVVIGFLHRHIWTIIEWPARPWLTSLIILAALLLTWAGGEVWFRTRKSGHLTFTAIERSRPG
jgi:hypothetical protein